MRDPGRFSTRLPRSLKQRARNIVFRERAGDTNTRQLRPPVTTGPVPGSFLPVRLGRSGGGQLAVAYLYGELGNRRNLGYLERRSARNRGLGGGPFLLAEVRE